MLSINLTIHNKEFLLKDCLERIKKFTKGGYEIVTVLDGCADNSEKILDEWILENPQIQIKKLIANNVFETKANNIAAKESSGDYIAIIQDDMLVNEEGWDLRMLEPFHKFNDVFSVTSRSSHNWKINTESRHINLDKIPDGVWSDILIHTDHAHKDNTQRNVFEIRDSSNRGPLVINREDLKSLNYFDEIFSPQDMDDHDLHYRAKRELGKVTGLYWVEVISNLEWGGTREQGKTKQWMLDSNHKNQKIILERHRDFLKPGRVEKRYI